MEETVVCFDRNETYNGAISLRELAQLAYNKNTAQLNGGPRCKEFEWSKAARNCILDGRHRFTKTSPSRQASVRFSGVSSRLKN